MVSNQDGLGTASFPEEDFLPPQRLLLEILKSEGIEFADIYIDCSFEEEKKATRKPGTAMLGKYLKGGYDLENSYVIGDRETDIELARNLGTKSIFFSQSSSENADFRSHSWEEIVRYLTFQERGAELVRETKETQGSLRLLLDSQQSSSVSTGIGFFDHMLLQIAQHGKITLELSMKGDLHVDEHHTVEDSALMLGEAIRQALGDKRGISRFGFACPMDDCRAQVLIDFSGRPAFEWEAEFQREKVGDLPTEMFPHFFKSFSDAAACNLHIMAKGKNEHHKIEAIFKSFARALRAAVRCEENDFSIPSSKGLI